MGNDKLEGSALIRQVVRDDPADVVAGIGARSGWDTERSRQFLSANIDEFDRQTVIAEANGDLYVAAALRLGLRILKRSEAELDSLDLMEAMPLLRYVDRVLDRIDRMRAAERDKKERPVLHVTIFGRKLGSASPPDTQAEVIDAETVEVKPVASHEPARLTAEESNPLAFLDVLKGATPVRRDEVDHERDE